MLKASQFARYAVAGGAGTIVHWGSLWAFVGLAGIDPRVATAMGYSLAVVTNYTIQHSYTFRSDLSHRTAFSRFLGGHDGWAGGQYRRHASPDNLAGILVHRRSDLRNRRTLHDQLCREQTVYICCVTEGSDCHNRKGDEQRSCQGRQSSGRTHAVCGRWRVLMRDRCEASPMTASSAHHAESRDRAKPDQRQSVPRMQSMNVSTRSFRTGPVSTSTTKIWGAKTSRAFSKRGEGGRDDTPKAVNNTRRGGQ